MRSVVKDLYIYSLLFGISELHVANTRNLYSISPLTRSRALAKAYFTTVCRHMQSPLRPFASPRPAPQGFG